MATGNQKADAAINRAWSRYQTDKDRIAADRNLSLDEYGRRMDRRGLDYQAERRSILRRFDLPID